MTVVVPPYQAALERLFGLERGGGKLGLEGTRILLERLGHPEGSFASLHVAGTNGKGSTACYLERLLRASGCVTGLYTSPHLVDFRERVRIAGRAVSADEVVEGLETISALDESAGRTFFEVSTALAFRAFAEHEVEVVVAEVGLGGRLDCTNVLAPSACVLTPVALDHTEILGTSLEAVAGEKAGILKRGVPAVTASQNARVRRVFERAAAEAGAPLVAARERVRVVRARPTESGTETQVSSPELGALSFRLRAVGKHQAENAALALAAFGVVVERGLTTARGRREVAWPAPETIVAALESARWPGRLERSRREPRLWWDGAHNPHGARALRQAWAEGLADAPATLVLGCSLDKDVDGFLGALAGPWRSAYACAPATPRALAASVLANRMAGWGIPVTVVEGVAEAVRTAIAGLDERPVLVTGSLFTVGEAMVAVGEPPPEVLP